MARFRLVLLEQASIVFNLGLRTYKHARSGFGRTGLLPGGTTRKWRRKPLESLKMDSEMAPPGSRSWARKNRSSEALLRSVKDDRPRALARWKILLRTRRSRLEPSTRTGTGTAIARAARRAIRVERCRRRQEAGSLSSARLRHPSASIADWRPGPSPRMSPFDSKSPRLSSLVRDLNARAGSGTAGLVHVSAPRRTPRAC